MVRASRPRARRAARASATRRATCWALPARRRAVVGRPARTWTACARGGRFDGPLGVAAALRGRRARRAGVAVLAFADEEGARFNTPTFGSPRAGRPARRRRRARARRRRRRRARRRDARGRRRPGGLADAPAWLARLRGFLELHIDQTRDLERAGAPAGAVRGLAARLRLRARARTAAPTTRARRRRDERRDALAAAARLIVAADELARADPDFVVTAARILVEPNALDHGPARVRLWLDARAPERGRLDALARRAGASAADAAGASPSSWRSRRAAPASRSTPPCAPRSRGRWPELVCFAGHDAGILAERHPGRAWSSSATRPASATRRDEHVALEDAAVAATAAARARWRRSREPIATSRRWSTRTRTPSSATCAGAAERPAPEAHADDDFWTWREAMYRLAGALDPDAMRDVAPAASTREMARRRLRRRRRVPLRPPPARRHAVRRAERAGDRRRRGRASTPACEIVLLPAAYHRDGWDGGDRPPSPASAASATPTSRRSSRASTRCAPGRRARGRHVGVAAHSVRAVPARLARGDRRATPTTTASSATSTRTSSARELEECRAEHGCSPIELLRPHRLPRPAHERRPRRSTSTTATSRCSPTADTIVVSCPTTEGNLGDGHFPALRYRDAGVRIAIGSDSQVRIDPFEEARELETLRPPRAPHAPRAARPPRRPVGGARRGRPREPRPRRRRHGHGRPRPPRPRGVADDDLPLAVATCASAAVVARR